MLEPGDEIDVWVVDKALGRGGMGSVYRCHNRRANRILAAVKVLEQAVRASPNAEARFVREAEILFSLDHPNIVKVRNVRMDGETPFIEMEFVEGESLEDRLNRGPLPTLEMLQLSVQLTDAVAYLHARGVRHRDVKPANVLLRSDGVPKLVDFGIAMEETSSRLTQGGMMFGSVAYAPPEWIAPETMDPELWDVYSLGVVIWEMCTGEVAFPVPEGGSVRQQVMNVMMKKQDHAPLDPGEHFPAGLRDVIGRMTHPSADRRMASVVEANERLATVLGNFGSGDSRTERPKRDVSARRGASETFLPMESDRQAGETLLPTEGPETPPISPELANAATLPPRRDTPKRPGPPLLLWLAIPLALVLLGVLGAAIWRSSDGASGPKVDGGVVAPRPVALTVEGVDAELGVQLRVAGVDASEDGGAFVLSSVPVGEAPVHAIIGEGCTCEPNCVPGCAEVTTSVTVPPGEGRADLTVTLALPPSRSVALTVDGPASHTATLDGVAAVEGGWEMVSAGPHVLLVQTGSCPEDAAGCSDEGSCPSGCRSVRQALDVEASSDPLAVSVSLPALNGGRQSAATEAPAAAQTPTPAPRAPVVVAPKTPPPAAAGPAAAALVTSQQFASWLAGNPSWQRDAAIAAGLADDRYLKGWDGTSPPSGRAGIPMVDVSWYAAEAFCKARGGLAGTDAAPTTWSDTRAPALEFRGRTPSFVDNTGTVLPAQGSKANSFAGIRCSQ